MIFGIFENKLFKFSNLKFEEQSNSLQKLLESMLNERPLERIQLDEVLDSHWLSFESNFQDAKNKFDSLLNSTRILVETLKKVFGGHQKMIDFELLEKELNEFKFYEDLPSFKSNYTLMDLKKSISQRNERCQLLNSMFSKFDLESLDLDSLDLCVVDDLLKDFEQVQRLLVSNIELEEKYTLDLIDLFFFDSLKQIDLLTSYHSDILSSYPTDHYDPKEIQELELFTRNLSVLKKFFEKMQTFNLYFPNCFC